MFLFWLCFTFCGDRIFCMKTFWSILRTHTFNFATKHDRVGHHCWPQTIISVVCGIWVPMSNGIQSVIPGEKRKNGRLTKTREWMFCSLHFHALQSCLAFDYFSAKFFNFRYICPFGSVLHIWRQSWLSFKNWSGFAKESRIRAWRWPERNVEMIPNGTKEESLWILWQALVVKCNLNSYGIQWCMTNLPSVDFVFERCDLHIICCWCCVLVSCST